MDKFVLVSLDKILVYSETKHKRFKGLKTVLKKLSRNEVYSKMSKCEFRKSRSSIEGT